MLSLQLEAMRWRNYFAKQGGAIRLIIVDSTTTDARAAEEHTALTLTAINQAHQVADLERRAITRLSPAIGSAVIAAQGQSPTVISAMLRSQYASPRATILLPSDPAAPAHEETLAVGQTVVVTAPALQRALNDVLQQKTSTGTVEPDTTTHTFIPTIPVPTQITTDAQAAQLAHFRTLASGG